MGDRREFNEDEIGKEMQIKILKEKLDFVNNQLEEKDRQLDHYKQLCKTLKDLVSELSARGRQTPGGSLSPAHNATLPPTTPPSGNPIGVPKEKVRPPPGFEAKKNSIKGRKVRSFHTIRESFGEDDPFGDDTSGADSDTWRRPDNSGHHAHLLPHSPITSSQSASVVSPTSTFASLTPTTSGTGTGPELRRSDDLQWRRPNMPSPIQIPTNQISTSTSSSVSSTPTSTTPSTTTTTPDFHHAVPSILVGSESGSANGSTKSTPTNANVASRLKKSVSQSSITNTWTQEKEREREREKDIENLLDERERDRERERDSPRNPFTNSPGAKSPLSAITYSASASVTLNSNGSGSSPGSVDSKKMSKLKKSQSMNSVYTVLEENRLDIDLKFPELDQLIGQIYPLSKYQQGCRFLQKKLDEKNATNTNIILNELYDHLVELLTDPFGNYLFSKLMEHCDSPQRDRVVAKILPDILTIAFDMYGTQSLQKMMPFLTETQIESVIDTLKQSSIALIKHNKANYLIQYCLDHLPPKHNQWIYDSVVACMEEIARDRVGCVIVKRCIDHATEEQKHKITLEISNKVLALVQDPFGNYVVQHVLDKFPRETNSSKMIINLIGSVNELCVQKFSSNVIEKCLQVSNAETKAALLNEIIESDMLPQLLNDRFANFVIQTALDVAEQEQRQALVKNILPHLGRHYSPYTKRLQKKILQGQ